MPESIESFVKKLQEEGVDAGKKAAEGIRQEAEREAERIIAAAEDEADRIVEEAKKDAARRRSRAETDLELAVRDTVLRLRASLSDILSALLTRRIAEKLSDSEYLGEVIREVVLTYARSDAEKQSPIEIDLPDKMRDRLKEGVLRDLQANLKADKGDPRLRSRLLKAGFEYRIRGGTVEVSPESVSDILSEMVNPALQEILEKASGHRAATTGPEKQDSDQGSLENRVKSPENG